MATTIVRASRGYVKIAQRDILGGPRRIGSECIHLGDRWAGRVAVAHILNHNCIDVIGARKWHPLLRQKALRKGTLILKAYMPSPMTQYKAHLRKGDQGVRPWRPSRHRHVKRVKHGASNARSVNSRWDNPRSKCDAIPRAQTDRKGTNRDVPNDIVEDPRKEYVSSRKC